jgi:hypothetical protein
VFLDARPTADGLKPGIRNPLLDLAAPEVGTTFFASNTLQRSRTARPGAAQGAFMRAILDTLEDEKADSMPTPPDRLINALELAQSIKTRIQQASAGRQMPTFFAAAPQRGHNLLELYPGDLGN